MSKPCVHIEFDDSIAVLTLTDSARKNAMSVALGDAFLDAIAQVIANARVRAVVITGANSTFSAGGDLNMLEQLKTYSSEDAKNFMLNFYSKFLSITELSIPTIAAVQGPAIGAGLCVAMACDLCLAAEDATLSLNFSRFGLYPGMGATYLAPLRFGALRAAELMLTGRKFKGIEAAQWGMALRALPSDQVQPEACRLAHEIASNAPLVVRALKRKVSIDRAELNQTLEREAQEQAYSYKTQDFHEGLTALKARRNPIFEGF